MKRHRRRNDGTAAATQMARIRLPVPLGREQSGVTEDRPEEDEGGAAVREPRRPLPQPPSAGAVALDHQPRRRKCGAKLGEQPREHSTGPHRGPARRRGRYGSRDSAASSPVGPFPITLVSERARLTRKSQRRLLRRGSRRSRSPDLKTSSAKSRDQKPSCLCSSN